MAKNAQARKARNATTTNKAANANTATAANTATQQGPAQGSARSAATLAAQVAAGNAPPGFAAQPTGNVAGRQQKLVYPSGSTQLKLVPAAARGTQQRAYLAYLQAAMPGGKATADGLLTALAQANVPNPRRVLRRSVRWGMLVLA